MPGTVALSNGEQDKRHTDAANGLAGGNGPAQQLAGSGEDLVGAGGELVAAEARHASGPRAGT